MKKFIGILLSVALIVTMMPVCSLAASTSNTELRIFTAVPTTYLESEEIGTNTFFMGKGDARTFLFSASTVKSNGDSTLTWLGPKAGDFKIYEVTTTKNTKGEIKTKRTLLKNPPFKITYNAKVEGFDKTQLKGLKPVKIQLNKYVPFGTVYQLKYVGTIGKTGKKPSQDQDSIYFIASNFKNGFTVNSIEFSVSPTMAKEDANKLPVTGQKLYLFNTVSGSPVHWDIDPAKAKIYNEYNKDVTAKFEVAKDENGVYLKTDKKIYGLYQIVYDRGSEAGMAIFAVNDSQKGVDDAKSVAPTLKTKVAKKKVTLTISSKGKYLQDGYQVYRSTKKTSGFKKIGTTESKSYIDTTAKAKKTYYYKVRTYKMLDGTYFYGKWSKVMKVKAK